VDYALSREQKNKSGGKMYIQDKVEEYADIVSGSFRIIVAFLHRAGACRCRARGSRGDNASASPARRYAALRSTDWGVEAANDAPNGGLISDGGLLTVRLGARSCARAM
jgi:hypothetical protein